MMNNKNAKSTAALLSFLTLSDYKETEDKACDSVKLQIIEQPQEHCRYRYKSEMNKQGGSHGPLYGTNSTSMKKSYPSVRLYNYDKEARIRVKLIQTDTYFDHPHTLTEHDLGMDAHEMVSAEKRHGYLAIFNNLKLINTEKNKSYSVVLEKCKIQLGRANKTYSLDELERICREFTQGRNKPSQNNVRMMFSAHHPVTDELLCKPVVSDVVNNGKSAETNILKIAKSSITKGKPVGDDELILLVEKIQKDNIKVDFVEIDEDNEEVWRKSATFLPTDVHKQYAIVCRTPAYKQKEIDKDVKVYIELVRPSNKKTSNRLSFTYIANTIRDRSYASFGSSIGSSLSSRDIPQPALMVAQGITATDNTQIRSPYSDEDVAQGDTATDNTQIRFPYSDQDQIVMDTGDLLADAFQANYEYTVRDEYEMSYDTPMMDVNSTASLPAGLNNNPSNPPLPNLSLNSSEFSLPSHLCKLSTEDVTQMGKVDWSEYSESHHDLLCEFARSDYLISDSAKVKIEEPDDTTDLEPEITIKTTYVCDPDNGSTSPIEKDSVKVEKTVEDYVVQETLVTQVEKTVEDYVVQETQVEKAVEDYVVQETLVTQLVPDFCTLLKNNVNNDKKKQIEEKLHEIFKFRFADGGTFLHWGINTRKLVNVEVLVKYLSEYKMYDYMNVQDNEGQTLLHHAVKRNLHQKIDWFISCGCSPNIVDDMGNSPLHIAVLRNRCVKEIVNAIKNYEIEFDFDAKNIDGHTALYLACVHVSLESVQALVSVSTSLGEPENVEIDETYMGIRTPLHLAALTHNLEVFTALMGTGLKLNVDGLDDRGYTALQILCGGEMKEHTLEIASMLLKHGANPALKIGTRQSALELCYGKQELCDLLYKYVDGIEVKLESDFKSELTDYDTAEEEEVFEHQLEGLSAFKKPLSEILDKSGKWRELATNLGMESLINMLAEAPSPTTQLLDQIQIVDPSVTSPSIAKILFEMDEIEAGQIILDYVDV